MRNWREAITRTELVMLVRWAAPLTWPQIMREESMFFRVSVAKEAVGEDMSTTQRRRLDRVAEIVAWLAEAGRMMCWPEWSLILTAVLCWERADWSGRPRACSADGWSAGTASELSSTRSGAGLLRCAGVVAKLDSPEVPLSYPGTNFRCWFASSAASPILIALAFFFNGNEAPSEAPDEVLAPPPLLEDLKENLGLGAKDARIPSSFAERALIASP